MAKQPEDSKTYDIPTLISPAARYIEDATAKDAPIAADSILTDQQLERGGLVKIEAFMRTRTSTAAARKAKQREKQATEGLKTITLVAPVAANEPLRQIAKACSEGKSIEEAIKTVTSHGQVTAIDPNTARLAAIGQKVEALTGWKRQIAHLLKLI